MSLFRELELDDPIPSADRWASELMHHTLVADDGGGVKGYVNFYRLGQLGHVRNLVVTQDARNRGVGHRLMTASKAALRAAGAGEWHLNVKASNAAAIHLYEKLGMRAEHRSTIVRLRWTDVAKLPAELATVLPVAPDEDDDIERAFAMPSGRIAMTRQRDRVLLQLRDRELAPVGFAAFDIAFPGMMPFRVARPALAATLIAAMRKHAKHEHVGVAVENDEALAGMFIDAGAEVRRQLLHYVGRLD